MNVWRIAQKHHTTPPLNGIGGLYASGRWHSKGQLIVYTAASQALAILESIVHFDPANAPVDLVMISADISPVSCRALNAKELGKNWKTRGTEALRHIGDQWLQDQSSCVLQVPSVMTPNPEYNYLMNPLHPEFAKITDVQVEAFVMDPRLF